MSFAALESRVASTSLAKLANVEATIGGEAVAGVFDNGPAEAFSGVMAGVQPRLRCSASIAAPEGESVQIGAIAYQVAEVHVMGPDQILVLERV